MAPVDYNVSGTLWETTTPLTITPGLTLEEEISKRKTEGTLKETKRSFNFNYDKAVNHQLIGWETVKAYVEQIRDAETYPYITVNVKLTPL